jgi:hypothetical protein
LARAARLPKKALLLVLRDEVKAETVVAARAVEAMKNDEIFMVGPFQDEK